VSQDYPNRADWLAKRATWRNRHKHERPYVNFGGSRRERLGKAGNRVAKKSRRESTYRSFFADPAMQAKIEQQKLTWCIQFHPRLVRDTVLGSR